MDWWMAIKPSNSNMYLYVDSSVIANAAAPWKGFWWSTHTVDGLPGRLTYPAGAGASAYAGVNGAGAVKLTFDSIVNSATRVVYNDNLAGQGLSPGFAVGGGNAHAKGAVGWQGAGAPGPASAAWMIHTVPGWIGTTYPHGGALRCTDSCF